MTTSLDRERERFRQREAERAEVHATLEPIVRTLADAESKLASFSVMTSEERYRLGRARLEILSALRSLDRAGDTLTDHNLRAADAATRRMESADDELH